MDQKLRLRSGSHGDGCLKFVAIFSSLIPDNHSVIVISFCWVHIDANGGTAQTFWACLVGGVWGGTIAAAPSFPWPSHSRVAHIRQPPRARYPGGDARIHWVQAGQT